jgi:hypothetical protein
MKTIALAWLTALCTLVSLLAGAESSHLAFASDFPGGNIVLERIEGDDVSVHQDLRDTKGDWFYWYFASYVAEGFMDAFLDDSETTKWLREHVQCAVVPLVDKDGVEAGDQGKNRKPHDHKADYRGTSIYPEVAALREFVTKWAGGKPAVTLDLHNPAISHQVIYTHALRGTEGRTPDEIAAILASSGALRFLQTVEKVQTGPLKCRVKDSLDFAARIRLANPASEAAERGQKADTLAPAASNPSAPISIGFEIPYALVGEVPVTPESARAFGGDIAKAVVAYLKSRL